MIRIGLVGIGFMGWIHWLGAGRLKGARVAAVCSRDPKKLAGDWRGIRGNFGPPGQMVDLAGVKKYDRLEALLQELVDLSPRGIRTHLNLNRPIYLPTASYGHFGRDAGANGEFSWEKLDLVEKLRSEFGISAAA